MNCADLADLFERERVGASSGVVDLRFGESFFAESPLAGALPFSFSCLRLDPVEGRRFEEGLGGGEASVAYGEPGIGASGCPRSYDNGDTDAEFGPNLSLDIERRSDCLEGLDELGLGLGEEGGEFVVGERAEE